MLFGSSLFFSPILLDDMVIARSDTVKVTLGWSFLILCTMPDIQRKIQQELDTFITKHHRLPVFSERDEIPYLIAVQKECLRFRPTTPCGAPHLVEQDGIYMHISDDEGKEKMHMCVYECVRERREREDREYYYFK